MQEINKRHCSAVIINVNQQLLLITVQTPIVVCLQEIFLKQNDELNIKDFKKYIYTHDTGLRPSGGKSIPVKKVLPQSKINLATLQVTAVKKKSLHLVCIPSNQPENEAKNHQIIKQLPAHFMILGYFNCHNTLWGCTDKNPNDRILETILYNNDL